MADLKLAKLPDRTPAKITIIVPAELNQALRDYAEAYRERYESAESVAELIPFMLAAFIKSDVGYKKGKRDRQVRVPRCTPRKLVISERE